MVVNVGVIGTGMIGRYHAERLAGRIAGARVAAVFDVVAARATALAAEIGAVAHRDPDDLIRGTGVDAVVVASPGHTHAELVLACIAAGTPVLSEKPLATTADDCLEVVEAEVALGSRLVQVGFMRRFDGGYRALKSAIDDGAVGDPLVVHCVHRNPSVPDTFTSEMLQTDSVIHEIDAARWLLGEELVAATVLSPKRSPHAAPHLQDPQLVVLESASGAIVQVEMFVNARYGYDVRCEVVGADGTAALETPAITSIARHGTRASRVPADWKERFDDAFHAELQGWVARVAEGAPPDGPSAWDGYAATAVASACVVALGSGRRSPVTIVERPALYA